MNALRLPQAIVNDILTQASSHPDDEVCGLLGGRGNTASSCFPVANVSSDTHCRYVMDPAGQVDAMRRIRDAGNELVAIYHSHPKGLARPSVTDIQEANYADAVYLVVSLGTEGVLELAGFNIKGKSVSDVVLELI